MRSIKCVVIGDGAVGKTSLLISYTTNTFPTDYVPTVFDNYTTTISVDPPNNNTTNSSNTIPTNRNLFKLNLWDTAGQEEYDRLRPLSYPQTDIFLLCFAVNERTSFKNLTEKWLPELKQHANIENNDIWQSFKKLPIILVGTKADLRDEVEADEDECIDTDDINAFVADNHILKYVECSAKNQTGITDIFQTVVHKLVYEYDPILIKPKQQQIAEHPKQSVSPPTPPPEKIEKKNKPITPITPVKQNKKLPSSTNTQKKRSIHNDKHPSFSSSSSSNTNNKSNKRKTSCIIM
ncbi:GTP-binding protein Rho5p [Monosporozyma servazzii]